MDRWGGSKHHSLSAMSLDRRREIQLTCLSGSGRSVIAAPRLPYLNRNQATKKFFREIQGIIDYLPSGNIAVYSLYGKPVVSGRVVMALTLCSIVTASEVAGVSEVDVASTSVVLGESGKVEGVSAGPRFLVVVGVSEGGIELSLLAVVDDVEEVVGEG